ncbi:MAG: pilin [Enterobacterales bacterium]|nr:pilin [Enterobacterales bacterium]
MLTIILAGIGYAVYSDPDFKRQQIFIYTLKSFAKQLKPLESQYKLKQVMLPQRTSFTVSYTDAEGQQKIDMMMQVEAKLVRLSYPKEGDLDGETIVLEPVIKQQKVLWKCLNGSLLTRYRIKDCRLGYAVDLHQIEAKLLPNF